MSLYTSDPAPPLLAPSLLSQPIQPDRDINAPKNGTRNLATAIEEGIQCSSASDAFFRPGLVIGFSRPRRRGSDDEDHGYIGQIPRYLLTTHLLQNPSPGSGPGQPTTFIIHPATSPLFSPQTLLNALLLSQNLSREEAITRLDAVQLLPIFDFPAAMQAITQVSETLDKLVQCQQATATDQDYHPIVLIIAGLDTLVESVVRASNPIKGTAVLNAALRTLTRLSRVHAAFLSVLLVNTSGLGLGAGTEAGAVGAVADGDWQGELAVLLPSLLMKTLDQGIDMHLLVSVSRGRGRGRVGVEVVKDRVGGGLGMSGVWDG